jgi:hypothetical protein
VCDSLVKFLGRGGAVRLHALLKADNGCGN